MILEYEGTDITDSVSVDTCWHYMYAEGHADTLTLRCADTEALWDKWGPKRGDVIKITDGAATTGRMWLDEVKPKSSLIHIHAMSIPDGASKERHAKSWEHVRLSQLLQEVCTNNGLGYEPQGFTDRVYSYVEQGGVPDLQFIARRCAYEGLAFLIFNGSLVVYDMRELESETPAGTITVAPGIDYDLDSDDDKLYGSCTVTDGTVRATYEAEDGKNLELRLGDKISDQAEGERFAQHLLHFKNRRAKTIKIVTETFLRQYAAGSTFDLESTSSPSWNGPAFVDRMMHDYVNRRSMLWAHKAITEY